jgi:glycosyltransferase involved in cell wall biosynthesis
MKTPLTAVIPISNYDAHAENIKAILEIGTLHGVELILVMDNQSNQAFEALCNIATKMNIDGRVIQDNSGNPGGARNSGKLLATRHWITFWDCDDYPILEEVTRLVMDAETTKAEVAIGAFEIENLRNGIFVRHVMNLKAPQVNVGLNPGIWRMIFRYDVLKGINFPNLSMAEDQVFIQRVINQNLKVIFRNYAVYRYRTGVNNQLTSDVKRKKDLTAANSLATNEYNPQGKQRKMAITMLMRQKLTILKTSDISIRLRFHLVRSLLRILFLNPEILIHLTIQKYSNLRKMR